MKQKNKYHRRSKRPIPPEFVKLELWLPHLSHAKLLRSALDQDLAVNDLAVLGLLKAISHPGVDLLLFKQLIPTGEGSESYPTEQEQIYDWLKGMGSYGLKLIELITLCLDFEMSHLALSYAINGLLLKGMIEMKGDVIRVTKEIKTPKLFKSVKGKRTIKRKLPEVTIFKKETR